MATPRMVKASTNDKDKNVTFKMRSCMNPECKKRFLSDHAGIRFCGKCRHVLCTNYYDDPHRVYL